MIMHQKTSKEELCKTMKKRKLMMTVMSLALVLVVAVGGTLAYLSDQSNTVTNTFNVGDGYKEDEDGNVGLWLDETNVLNPVERTKTGNKYEDMLPGSQVKKDPIFHLTEGSLDSYVFAYVTGLDDIIDKGFLISDSAVEPLVGGSALNSGWTKVYGAEDSGLDGLYVYGTVDDEGINATVLSGGESTPQLFGYVWYGSTVDNDLHDENYAAQSTAQLEKPDAALSEIVIKGVAVQTANLTAEDAMGEAIDVLSGVAALG